MNDTILINRLPTRTWNRLGVNETAIAWGQADDLGTERITAAGQIERLEITGSGERGEKTVDVHVPAGQTVTVFETLRAEKGLLVRTALHVERMRRCVWCRSRTRRRTRFFVWRRAASARKTVRWS